MRATQYRCARVAQAPYGIVLVMTPLAVAWAVYSASTLLEVVLLSVKTSLHVRRPLAFVCLAALCASHAALLATEPLAFGVPFACIGFYRIINVMRFAYGRMHTQYLYAATGRSSMVLGVLQAGVGLLAWQAGTVSSVAWWCLTVLCVVSVCLLISALVSAVYGLAKSKIAPLETAHSSELPSVTVAIPARNETEDLAACLESFIASDYIKLEILVLDDCSSDKTADIIKHFAHAGVRFIQGSEPGDTWLAKNAAYQKLANEATGDYILFCGVDVRVAKDTVRKLMTTLLQQNVRMVSVLPTREKNASTVSDAQIVRYLWELCMPRALLKRPPVLSTAWVVHAQSLQEAGSFKAVKRMVVPEAYFAKVFYTQKSYAFWRASSTCELTSTKSAAEQRRTMVRVRYPQLHKRPEALAAVTLTELAVLLSPKVAFVHLQGGVRVGYFVLFAAISLAIAVVCSRAVSRHKRVYYALQVLLALPFDVVMSHVSMWKYEFSSVEWKDRNVCLPVMHVFPSLPKLPD